MTFAPALAVAPDGEAYLTAGFTGTLDTDPTPNATTPLAQSGANTNLFLLRLNPDGNLRYATAANTPGNDLLPTAIALDGLGRANVTASSQQTPDPGADPNDPVPDTDAYLYQFNARGRSVYVRHWDDNANDVIPKALAADAAGNLVLAGLATSRLDLDHGPATHFVSAL